MQTSDRYWNQYNPNYQFFFWFRNRPFLNNNKKIAIGVSKRTWEVALMYNGADNGIRTPILPSYIKEVINKEKEKLKKKELEQKRKELLSKFTLNPQTNRYDCDGTLDNNILKNFISEDKDGFIINFGKITGIFDCSKLDLISLKGAPQEVGLNFYCNNNRLTSLKGAPQIVKKNFYCSYNQLTSLEGAPQTVGGGFKCNTNKLTSLEGAPQIVNEYFFCSENQLTSLKGAPRKVGGDFWCNYNRLTSLEGAPQIVYGDFYCSKNKLTSLKGIGTVTGRIHKDF